MATAVSAALTNPRGKPAPHRDGLSGPAWTGAGLEPGGTGASAWPARGLAGLRVTRLRLAAEHLVRFLSLAVKKIYRNQSTRGTVIGPGRRPAARREIAETAAGFHTWCPYPQPAGGRR